MDVATREEAMSGDLREAAEEFSAEIKLAMICHEGKDSFLPKRAIPAWLKFRTALAAPAVAETLTASNQRMWDLIRYERMDLHQQGLISDEEYAELAKDNAAVKRLEDYDAALAAQAPNPARERRIYQHHILCSCLPTAPIGENGCACRLEYGAPPTNSGVFVNSIETSSEPLLRETTRITLSQPASQVEGARAATTTNAPVDITFTDATSRLWEKAEHRLGFIARELNGGDYHGMITHTIYPVVARLIHQDVKAELAAAEQGALRRAAEAICGCCASPESFQPAFYHEKWKRWAHRNTKRDDPKEGIWGPCSATVIYELMGPATPAEQPERLSPQKEKT
jgi:hypothetical protein